MSEFTANAKKDIRLAQIEGYVNYQFAKELVDELCARLDQEIYNRNTLYKISFSLAKENDKLRKALRKEGIEI